MELLINVVLILLVVLKDELELSGTRTGFSPSPSVFPCHYHSPAAPHSFIYHVADGQGATLPTTNSTRTNLGANPCPHDQTSTSTVIVLAQVITSGQIDATAFFTPLPLNTK
jgi:hypothetical protein